MASLNKQYKRLVDIILRLLVVFLIFLFTYRIIEPFVSLVLWATVIAIALGPVHEKISGWLRNSPKIASTAIIILFLAIIIMPFVSLTEALIHNTRVIKNSIDNQELNIFTPNEDVKAWPVIGERLYETWEDIANNTAGFFQKHTAHVTTAVEFLIDIVTKSAKALLFFIASILVAGFILVYSNERRALGKKIGLRLAGEQGGMFASVAESTIKNVVVGVIGVAVVQALLVGIGLFVGGVPYAGIWTLLCLVLAVVQVGPMPIVVPIVIWFFYANNITPSIFFAIWMGIAMISDNVLKPILYGRGSTVPMLVIFVGAVGGLLYSGIIGLFLGPVFLAFAYELFRHWLNEGEMKPIPELEGGPAEVVPKV